MTTDDTTATGRSSWGIAVLLAGLALFVSVLAAADGVIKNNVDLVPFTLAPVLLSAGLFVAASRLSSPIARACMALLYSGLMLVYSFAGW